MTSPDLTTGGLAALRADFPAGTVGKLPRSTCKRCSDSQAKVCEQHAKRECSTCGNYMSTAHMHLDYVGHAEVTDRLLSVDPEWSWEPVAWTEAGLPLIAKGASGEWTLWIRLTVCGVTRLGVGTVSGGFDTEKQLIGDALRNAAMRFGVALNLWSKSELESAVDETPQAQPPTPERRRRGDLADRAKALPDYEYEKFKAWLAEAELPGIPKDFTDDQCSLAEEWLSNAESALEHDAETSAEAAVSPEKPSEPTPAPDAADEPAGASQLEDDPEAAAARRVAAAEGYAKSLTPVQLLVEFGQRNATAPRTVTEQRQVLADLLFADDDWRPA